jgi:hypothetical protein
MRPRERAAEAHQAKLEDIRTQVSSGALVIRQMTKAEQKKWAKQRAEHEAKWSPQECARQETALKRRRQRAKHIAEITASRQTADGDRSSRATCGSRSENSQPES